MFSRNSLLAAFTVLALSIPGAMALPLPAAQLQAGMIQETRTPLVIIRFNQRNVYFERALYAAVKKALETKPGVIFDLLLHPGPQATGAANLNRVTDAMLRMGLPAERLQAAAGPASGQPYDEVRIYVR